MEEDVLEGTVESGIGVAQMWVGKIEKVFAVRTGMNVYHGTLNVKLDKDYVVTPDLTIAPNEYGGTQIVLVKRCKVLGNDAYIVRAEKNQKGEGEHNLQVVEIVSNINFREKYKLKDGEKLLIQIF